MDLTPQCNAFWDMTAASEIGHAILAASDDGYNVLVGSTPSHILTFDDYSKHPQIHNAATNSDAAGRGQFMGRYWAFYRDQLSLPDFGPGSQRKWFYQLLKECKAVADIEAGNLDAALRLTSSRWASFPYAPYNQHRNTVEFMTTEFMNAGGVLAQA